MFPTHFFRQGAANLRLVALTQSVNENQVLASQFFDTALFIVDFMCGVFMAVPCL